jgi:F-box and WD-40 domain protein 1/11
MTVKGAHKITMNFWLLDRSYFQKFMSWTEQDQTDFCKNLLQRMCHHQHGQIDQFLGPILQRDFISLLPSKH